MLGVNEEKTGFSLLGKIISDRVADLYSEFL